MQILRDARPLLFQQPALLDLLPGVDFGSIGRSAAPHCGAATRQTSDAVSPVSSTAIVAIV